MHSNVGRIGVGICANSLANFDKKASLVSTKSRIEKVSMYRISEFCRLSSYKNEMKKDATILVWRSGCYILHLTDRIFRSTL